MCFDYINGIIFDVELTWQVVETLGLLLRIFPNFIRLLLHLLLAVFIDIIWLPYVIGVDIFDHVCGFCRWSFRTLREIFIPHFNANGNIAQSADDGPQLMPNGYDSHDDTEGGLGEVDVAGGDLAASETPPQEEPRLRERQEPNSLLDLLEEELRGRDPRSRGPQDREPQEREPQEREPQEREPPNKIPLKELAPNEIPRGKIIPGRFPERRALEIWLRKTHMNLYPTLRIREQDEVLQGSNVAVNGYPRGRWNPYGFSKPARTMSSKEIVQEAMAALFPAQRERSQPPAAVNRLHIAPRDSPRKLKHIIVAVPYPKQDTRSGTKLDAETDTRPDTKRDTETGTGSYTKVDTESDTKVDAGSDTKLDTRSGTNATSNSEGLFQLSTPALRKRFKELL
ncbi:hypothetical protein BBP40_003469 [Aspergillus hancockii]|nr:hypothetical protein BBP40_003469 [Aspergillus hancockii]